MRVLLVEDNTELALTLAEALQAQHAVVDSVFDGAYADLLLRNERYDAVLLDLALPGRSGLDVLRRLRARGDKVPVLILTASGNIQDRVRGLDAGADDYLPKPFDLAELEARLRALNRRAHGHAQAVIEVGRLRYDSVARRFRIDDARLALRPREHALLEALIERQGQPVGKRVLVDHLCALEDSLSHDALEIYVHRLRRKLASSGAVIHTLRGLGYMLEAADAPTA